MSTGLQRRLLALLLVPLLLLAGFNTWFDYRLAGNASLQQDRALLALVPLLADSVVARPLSEDAPLPLLTAPPVDQFLAEHNGLAAYSLSDLEGRVRAGEVWLTGPTPADATPAYYGEEQGGVHYRVVAQRVQTVAGELVARIADGSDARQQWMQQLWFKVLLPNALLVLGLFFAVNWAVRRALRPLLELKDQVERRSPRDLSAFDAEASPDEVRPLVLALNRLFSLVSAQAVSQQRFVADAAHQLRTPLAALQAQVEAWAQASTHGGTADWRDRAGSVSGTKHALAPVDITVSAEQVQALRAAVRRTSQLANQLLALSRVEARQAHGAAHRVDLAQLCETVLLHHLDAAAAKGIDLGVDTAPAQVDGHEWLLREMLSNLVDNAIKYTPTGGHVTVRCGRKDGAPFLQVEDDGPGIAPTEHEQVLAPFYRVPGAPGEGSGLGLAIVQEIAAVHGTHVALAPSPLGTGLRASVGFPVQKP
ncbi:ATP-binding protein [Curvibacter sp. APW13]|uniref:ATP-binding protein n=1 Tax=Curvibacter sp. APW13 TaxID=3077236 RepID=UPI0028DD8515|nr:ATP-binding protein [Curvibacter sp. APW13]MDT8989857.1 ATP-binding protein [Curvibacter sp. APW13]